MLIYQAPSDRFINEVRDNTISDVMSETYKTRLGRGSGSSESLYHGKIVCPG